MDYEKKYNEALKWMRELYPGLHGATKEDAEHYFPELCESEDERIRKEMVDYFSQYKDDGIRGVDITPWIAYLEKQKGDKDELVYRLNGLMQDYIKEGKDDEEKEHRFKCYQLFWDALEDANFFEQKEQKPAECLKAERDGWYVCIKDFYAGGKKQCSVGDLVQAKGGMYMMGKEDISEWFRRAYYEEVRDAFGPNIDTNIPEKPAEWSKEDEKMAYTILNLLCSQVTHVTGQGTTTGKQFPTYAKERDWFEKRFKSLRPSWKPFKDEERLINTSISFLKDFADKGYENAVECIDWLKSKINGTSTNAK